MRKAKNWDAERARALLADGSYTAEQVAEMVGVSVSTIRAFKAKIGLTVPRRKAGATSTTPGATSAPPEPAPEPEPEPGSEPERPRMWPVDIRLSFRGWSVGLNAPSPAMAYEALEQLGKALGNLWPEGE